MDNYKKPRIGQKVYCFFDDSMDLCIEEVGYIGKESFIIEDYSIKCEVEFFYENYAIDWFTSLKQFKEYIKKDSRYSKYKCVKKDDDYWELEEK